MEFHTSDDESRNFDDFGLWIQVGIGMIAVAIIGAQCFCRNEETSSHEPFGEEARGLFIQIIDKTMSFLWLKGHNN